MQKAGKSIVVMLFFIFTIVFAPQIYAQLQNITPLPQPQSTAPCQNNVPNTQNIDSSNPTTNIILYLLNLFASSNPGGGNSGCTNNPNSDTNLNVGLTQNLIPPEYSQTTQVCKSKAQTGVERLLDNYQENLSVYKKASDVTGVAWEILAGIHYIEGGSSSSSSLVSGREIGTNEPDVVNAIGNMSKCNQNYSTGPLKKIGDNKCGFATLLDSAIYAGNLLKKSKYKMAQDLNAANNFDVATNTDFKTMAGALAAYNSPFHSQCEVENKSKYPFIFTNQKKSGALFATCKPKFAGEDHIYPMACLTKDYDTMYFCPGGSCQGSPYGKVGVFAFIRELQSIIKERAISLGTPDQPSTNDPVSSINSPPTKGYTFYAQCNPRYQKVPGVSMCLSGCGPTSTAQVLSSFVSSGYTPDVVGNILRQKGVFSSAGTGPAAIVGYLQNNFAGKIEVGKLTGSGSSNLSQIGEMLRKNYSDDWTFLFNVNVTWISKNGGTNVSGHHLWVVDIDENNNIWANDPRWADSDIIGNVAPPITLQGLITGKYRNKQAKIFTVKYFTPVRKKV